MFLKYTNESILSANASNDGSMLLTVHKDCIKIWDLAQCNDLETFRSYSGKFSQSTITQFSNDSTKLVIAETNILHIVDIKTNKTICFFNLQNPIIQCILSKDNKKIILLTQENEIYIGDVENSIEFKFKNEEANTSLNLDLSSDYSTLLINKNYKYTPHVSDIDLENIPEITQKMIREAIAEKTQNDFTAKAKEKRIRDNLCPIDLSLMPPIIDTKRPDYLQLFKTKLS